MLCSGFFLDFEMHLILCKVTLWFYETYTLICKKIVNYFLLITSTIYSFATR